MISWKKAMGPWLTLILGRSNTISEPIIKVADHLSKLNFWLFTVFRIDLPPFIEAIYDQKRFKRGPKWSRQTFPVHMSRRAPFSIFWFLVFVFCFLIHLLGKSYVYYTLGPLFFFDFHLLIAQKEEKVKTSQKVLSTSQLGQFGYKNACTENLDFSQSCPTKWNLRCRAHSSIQNNGILRIRKAKSDNSCGLVLKILRVLKWYEMLSKILNLPHSSSKEGVPHSSHEWDVHCEVRILIRPTKWMSSPPMMYT